MIHDFNKLKIGFAITGSYCTFSTVFKSLSDLVGTGADVYPIISDNVNKTDTRFANHTEFITKIENLTGHKVIASITEAEPIGPKSLLDIVVIAPCTGNTLAKLSNGIIDTPTLMASKAHLRNNKPLIIAISTNDALGINLKNIGTLYNTKNIYFVPFGQDNFVSKPNSMIADMSQIISTIDMALDGKQIQPVLLK
ncbi:MAG: dipicolinate synthase subunit B [Lachnospiraceae bacterium]|nr:dipicolinate synthase subunit B [Lachnospiraceae bacterium]